MLDILNPILRILLDYPIIIFSALGYFTGYLFKNINIYKLILLIILLPSILDLLIQINQVFQATFPFIFFAIINYLDKQKILYYLDETLYTLKNLLTKK